MTTPILTPEQIEGIIRLAGYTVFSLAYVPAPNAQTFVARLEMGDPDKCIEALNKTIALFPESTLFAVSLLTTATANGKGKSDVLLFSRAPQQAHVTPTAPAPVLAGLAGHPQGGYMTVEQFQQMQQIQQQKMEAMMELQAHKTRMEYEQKRMEDERAAIQRERETLSEDRNKYTKRYGEVREALSDTLSAVAPEFINLLNKEVLGISKPLAGAAATTDNGQQQAAGNNAYPPEYQAKFNALCGKLLQTLPDEKALDGFSSFVDNMAAKSTPPTE